MYLIKKFSYFFCCRSERSIVRVSIYQSSQPQQICPPEYFTKFEDNLDNSLSNYNCNLEDIMTTASPIPGYDRQQRYVLEIYSNLKKITFIRHYLM